MSAGDASLIDVGPATPPPNWCLPDAEPQWERLTDGGAVCMWSCDVRGDVWIEAEDRIIGGRVMRSAPRIQYWDPARDGITCTQAHELAEALVAAADIVACAAFDEASR